jgi:hypothetical protein
VSVLHHETPEKVLTKNGQNRAYKLVTSSAVQALRQRAAHGTHAAGYLNPSSSRELAARFPQVFHAQPKHVREKNK